MKSKASIYYTCKTIFWGVGLCFISYGCCYAQTDVLKDQLLTFNSLSDSAIKAHPAEKLYLQLDNPYYTSSDTIWLKAYLFNAPTLLFSAKSGLLHIDITSDSGKLIKQYLLPVINGTSWGNISLDSTTFKTGTYTLHAYTNWMRNFGEAGFYNKQFYITNPNENSWLINSKVSKSGINDKQTVNAQLQFTDINKLPVANAPMQLKVYAGTKNWYKQRVQTDKNGALDVNFTVPVKSSDLSIVAQSGQGGQKATIPIILDRPEKGDVQFLPEGGSLIAGLPANIGFKAIGEDGKGTDVLGIITDHNGQQVAVFQSQHHGIGSFRLLVKDGESYAAKAILPGGASKEFALPAVKSLGTVLQVKNVMESDSVETSITATDDIARSGNNYFLLAKSRGIICYAATFNFHNRNAIHKKIAKNLFPSGITHFILTTTSGQPLNERLVYIDHHDNLHIQATPAKTDCAPKDSVALQIKVTDNTGRPAAGNFSLSVTDDVQIANDTLKQDNIISHTLLSSELKGYIEDAGYYLQTKDTKSWAALDNLLLTQGWVNYDWPTGKQQADFPAETEFSVRGKVTNGFGKALSGTHVALLSKSPVVIKDTVTDKDGRFDFTHFPRIDTPAFILKAVNKNDNSFNVGIKVDEAIAPTYTMIYPSSIPWYVNSDSAIIDYTKNRDSVNKQKDYYYANGHRLKEVKILAQKTIKGSQNLNGPGNADLVLDEKDMEKAGKKSWLQILQENVKGFRDGTIFRHPNLQFALQNKSIFEVNFELNQIQVTPNPNFLWYFADDKPIVFIVDGIVLDEVLDAQNLNTPNLNDVEKYLKSHNAEDIKGIELISSTRYSGDYFKRYILSDWKPYLSAFDFSFIEITTRSGHGPFLNNTPGMYLYKPLALSYPKQFYKPKYIVNDTTKHLPDLRSTIDWEPNVITDKNGEATVSFYSADKPSTYTITIEGTDGNGNLGYKRQKLTISTKGNKAK